MVVSETDTTDRLTETISAMHRLVFPLSSRIVIGRSSRILSIAAGQFI